jgi:glyoxylase-like metal-dependent hydrolase (beta-lactamase superfamily II)
MEITQKSLPISKHFQLEKLADGVYAAISIDGTGSMSNAGIIDLGDRIVIFDTFFTQQAAEDLRIAVEQLTDKPVTYVINSHMHGDHVHGNQIFAPEADIIATPRTRELMETRVVENLAENKSDIAGGQAFLKSLEEQIEQEKNEDKGRQLQLSLATNREYLSAVPMMEIKLPNLTFEQKLVLHGSQRTAELLTFGGGHTDSDAFLYLPQERIAFMGDLLEVRNHPWMGDGHPEEWLGILDRVKGLDIAVCVPGHGPTGRLEDITHLQQYITTILQSSKELHSGNKPVEEAKKAAMPAPFDSWEASEVFSWNMEFLYERLTRP